MLQHLDFHSGYFLQLFLFSVKSSQFPPQAQTASEEGEEKDKLEKHRESPGARRPSLRKHVLSIGLTHYRHGSHIIGVSETICATDLLLARGP